MPPFQSEQPCPEPRQLPSARAHQRPRVPQQVDRRQLPGTGSAHTHATRLPSSVHTRPCGICCPRRPREQQPEPPLAVTRYQPRPDRIVPIRTRQHPGEPLRVSRPGPHESHHAGKVRAGNRACQGYRGHVPPGDVTREWLGARDLRPGGPTGAAPGKPAVLRVSGLHPGPPLGGGDSSGQVRRVRAVHTDADTEAH